MRISRRKESALFALTLLLVVSLGQLGIEVGKTSSTMIYVDPRSVTGQPCTNFTVNINIADVTDLYAWQVKLRWNPQLLDVVRVTEGDFLKTGGPTFFSVGIDESEGSILVFSQLDVSPPQGVTGSGTLAQVTFHGDSVGECDLDLSQTRLFNSAPKEVSTPPNLGDANGDLKVDIRDATIVAHAWGTSIGQPGYNPNADFNNDGLVDLYDMLCVAFNFGRIYPGTARQPVEITHEAQDGFVAIVPRFFPVSWKWLENFGVPTTITVNVTVSDSYPCYPIEDFDFSRSLGQISLSFTSATAGFCNVSVPKLLMDGAFKVLINNSEVASILTWNKTHTFIYFAHDQGTQNATIIGEIVTRIRSPNLLTYADLNGDGVVDMKDVIAVTSSYQWQEEP